LKTATQDVHSQDLISTERPEVICVFYNFDFEPLPSEESG